MTAPYVDPWDEREDSAAPPVCGGSPPRSGGDDDDETAFDAYQRRILGVKRPRLPQAPTPPIPLQAPRRAPPSEWDEFSSGRALRPDLDRTLYERSIAGYRDTAIRLAQFSRALESVVALENELRDAARIELVAQLYDWSSDTIEQSRLRVAPVHNQLRWMHASDADLRALRLPRFYVPLRVLESQPAADRRRWPVFIVRAGLSTTRVAAPGALVSGDIVLARTELPADSDAVALATQLTPTATRPTATPFYESVSVVVHRAERESSPAL